MKLYVIGTGGPPPAPTRFGSCFIVETQGTYLMFDCGPASTYKMAQLSLFPPQIKALFFTHHHFDHNADYPCFMLSRWDQQRGADSDFRVYGPPPTAEMTEKLFGENGAYRYDLQARMNHPASQNIHKHRGGTLPRPQPNFKAADCKPGIVTSGNGWKISCTEVTHVQPWLTSYAYRVDTEELSIVFTGDAGACPGIPELAQGADVLVAGIAIGKDRESIPHLAEVSTGIDDVAAYANSSGVKTVIITHMLESAVTLGSREKIAADLSAAYKGTIMIPDELQVIELRRR